MSEKTLRSFWMEWDTERATEWLRERYLSFRLHHAELQTHATPEEFADLFVEWCASAPGPLGDAGRNTNKWEPVYEWRGDTS